MNLPNLVDLEFCKSLLIVMTTILANVTNSISFQIIRVIIQILLMHTTLLRNNHILDLYSFFISQVK